MTAPAPPTATPADWREANRRCIMARVAEVRVRLQRRLESRDAASPIRGPSVQEAAESADAAEAAVPGESALARVARAFSLSPFEESILAACAAVELDTAVGGLCAQAAGDPDRKFLTASLALSILPEPHWTAVTPAGPLRRWRLVELTTGPSLTSTGLRIDERVLHFLMGASQIDARLAPLVAALPEASLLLSQQAAVDRAFESWQRTAGDRFVPVQVHGGDSKSRIAIAAAIARRAGLVPLRLPLQTVPANAQELEAFVRLWERESALDRVCPVLDCPGDIDAVRSSAVRSVIDTIEAPCIVAAAQPLTGSWKPELLVEAPVPQASEQLECWRQTLGPAAGTFGSTIRRAAVQFQLSPTDIDRICRETQAVSTANDDAASALWDLARRGSRGPLEELAQRLTATPGWDDLVLPEPKKEILRQIAAQVGHRATVYQEWGFDEGGTRGLGLAVLFTGPPGTGKTLAAEVLATHLKLDLYRIDLSAVVSKYIGETERNLRRLFDAAETCGAILFFDEADALFGHRSEVKDSHDRYANIEVSYLLQRMEAYRGLAILATNRKRALDQAFYRRLRFAVEFPFPDGDQRGQIWRGIFPKSTPVAELDYERLASLELAGGNIRNIAINAAFLAASDESPVSMSHLLAATRAEYTKLDRPLTQADIGGWV